VLNILETRWMVAFDPAAARQALGLPDGTEPVAFTALEELARYEGW